MTGFEPRTSGIGSDRTTNWATTTAQEGINFDAENRLIKNPINYLRLTGTW